MEILRSLLFVPAIRPRFIEKAPTVGADAICLDLEDSVPLDEKARAREAAAAALPELPRTGYRLLVRVNGLDTGLLEEDLYAVVSAGVDGISLPKAHDAEIVRQVDAYLTLLERVRGLPLGQLKLIPWIESARGVMAVATILAASPRIIAASFGAEDYTADLGIPRTAELREVEWARARMAVACHAAGVLPLDTPEPEIRDMEQVRRAAAYARSIGYRGKYCIHPDQVAVCNQVFSPSEQERAWARGVIEAYDKGVTQGLGAIALNGEMVDRPVYLRALKIRETKA